MVTFGLLLGPRLKKMWLFGSKGLLWQQLGFFLRCVTEALELLFILLFWERNADCANSSEIKWETQMTTSKLEGSLPSFHRWCLPGASHSVFGHNYSMIIRSWQHCTISFLYYTKTIQELTNSAHLCPRRQDSRRQVLWYTITPKVSQTAAVSAHTMHQDGTVFGSSLPSGSCSKEPHSAHLPNWRLQDHLRWQADRWAGTRKLAPAILFVGLTTFSLWFNLRASIPWIIPKLLPYLPPTL